MHRIFTNVVLNIISALLILVILFYRKRIKTKLRRLAGSGRLTEIRAMESQKEYCLMWIAIICMINLIARVAASI